jgi:Sulfotransferase domain
VPPKDVKLSAIEAQAHRRFLKTHLPIGALAFSPSVKYICIGRDGRDVIFSMYNHHANANERWYRAFNDSPGRIGPPILKLPSDIRQYFREWLDGDGYPFWPVPRECAELGGGARLAQCAHAPFRMAEARPSRRDQAHRRNATQSVTRLSSTKVRTAAGATC